MQKIKLALIGAGNIARKHLDVIAASEGVQAVGIASRTLAKAQALAQQFKIPQCADNIRDLVEKSQPDALMVMVSEEQILKVGKEVLSYKLPTFFEKPAGLSPQENLDLADLARKNKIPNMVGFNRRFYSIYDKGLKIIRDHGPLISVDVEGHERIWMTREGGKFSEYVMQNWIYANSVHTIDLLRFFSKEEPKDIMTIAQKFREKSGDQFSALMKFPSGTIGQYRSFWYSPGGWKVVLYGFEATVEFYPLEKGSWTDRTLRAQEILPDEVDTKFKPGFYRQMQAFEKLVRSGTFQWPMQDLEDSYHTMRLAERLTKDVQERSLK